MVVSSSGYSFMVRSARNSSLGAFSPSMTRALWTALSFSIFRKRGRAHRRRDGFDVSLIHAQGGQAHKIYMGLGTCFYKLAAKSELSLDKFPTQAGPGPGSLGCPGCRPT